jgi:hypothetical protein
MADETEQSKTELLATARDEMREGMRAAFGGAQDEPKPKAKTIARGLEVDDGERDEETDAPAPRREDRTPSKPQPANDDGKWKALRRKEKAERERVATESARLAEREKALADKEKAAEELKELKDLATKSPYELAKRLGMSIEQLAEEVTSSDSPEAKIKALEKRLAEKDERQTAAQREEAERAKDTAERQFVAQIRGSEKDFPESQDLSDRQLVEAGYEAARDIQAHLDRIGAYRQPTRYEVLREVEAREAAKTAKKLARHKARTAPAEEQEEIEEPPAPAPARRERTRVERREPEEDKPYRRQDTVNAFVEGFKRIGRAG